VQWQGRSWKQNCIQWKQRQQGIGHWHSNGLYPLNTSVSSVVTLDSIRRKAYKHGMSLTGKVAVVTGSSMGIGEAIAKLFADEGASVVILSRDAARAEAARQRIGSPDRTLALSCDVRNREEIDRVLGLALHHFQRVDIWVNNAGHGLLDSVSHAAPAAYRETFDTNFFGALQAMQAVIPVMKQQGEGTIINISSVAGHIPLPFHAIYSATKFALNAVGKAARVELSQSGIHVLTVCPGYVRTDFGADPADGTWPHLLLLSSSQREKQKS